VIVSVASGKGGTGKTTIATNLAKVCAAAGKPTQYLDCDVEEPNGHIFLKPAISESLEVSIPVPEVDETRCTLCGACGKACRFSAIVALPNKVVTFPELCHGCGGCSLACTERAIREVPRVAGVVEKGASGGLTFLQGRLNVGEAMAPPVIRAVLEAAPRDRVVVLDAPPGTSCPAIESVKTADVVLLVTEPTPFGLNDLKLAVEMLRQVGLPFGVAVNRAGIGDSAVFDYCAKERVPVLLRIPNDLEIARAYSRGELAVRALPELEPLFFDLYDKLGEMAGAAPRGVAGGQGEASAGMGDPGSGLSVETPPVDRQNHLAELVVISGKGGTGKTSIAASLFALAERAAVADCDVDAADLHLVLDPVVLRREPFRGGQTALIDAEHCSDCGLCADLCRFHAVRATGEGTACAYEIDPISCEGCGVCVDSCPEGAISLVRPVAGEWFVSETRHGPMVHARLGIAQENSGKLVSLVRQEARTAALSNGCELLVCDGSPGIGCPVIASIAGASLVLVVTEPTLSGVHDLRRVVELCRQFDITMGVCVNKADVNPEVAAQIEAECARWGVPVLGRIRYDDTVTAAQVKRLAVVENGVTPAASDIRALWENVRKAIDGPPRPGPVAE
jgi:MinD superfamily P-loop ATPase